MQIYRLGPTIIPFVCLILFTIVNPIASLDLFIVALIVFLIIYKILGNYALIALLTLRPTLDIWREYLIINYNQYVLNLNAAVALILLIWSIYFFWKHQKYFTEIPLRHLFIIFIIWCICTFFWSHDHAATISETLKAANLFALFGVTFILNKINTENFQTKFTWAFGIATIIPWLLAGYQWITQTGMSIDGTANRLYGSFAHPNILATFSLLIFIYFWRQRSQIKNKDRQLLLYNNIILLTALLIITFTYTRIAWIGLIIFLTIMGWQKNWRLTLGVISFGLVLYLSFFPINQFLIRQFNLNLQENGLIARITTRNPEADSIKWRADIFNKVMPLWTTRPLLGYGYGAFATVWDENKGTQNIWDNTSEAHNDYLKVGFESGLIGLSLFSAIFIYLLYLAIKKRDVIWGASILIYLVLSASDNMLHHTPVIWWWFAVWGIWAQQKEVNFIHNRSPIA